MADAKHGEVAPLGQFDQGREPVAHVALSVAIAADERGREGVDDQQRDVMLDDGILQQVQVLADVEEPFPLLLIEHHLHGTNLRHVGAEEIEAGTERVGQRVLASTKSVRNWGAGEPVGPCTTAGAARRDPGGQRALTVAGMAGEDVELAESQPARPEPVDRLRRDVGQ